MNYINDNDNQEIIPIESKKEEKINLIDEENIIPNNDIKSRNLSPVVKDLKEKDIDLILNKEKMKRKNINSDKNINENIDFMVSKKNSGRKSEISPFTLKNREGRKTISKRKNKLLSNLDSSFIRTSDKRLTIGNNNVKSLKSSKTQVNMLRDRQRKKRKA